MKFTSHDFGDAHIDGCVIIHQPTSIEDRLILEKKIDDIVLLEVADTIAKQWDCYFVTKDSTFWGNCDHGSALAKYRSMIFYADEMMEFLEHIKQNRQKFITEVIKLKNKI